jgi:hypothetical protein
LVFDVSVLIVSVFFARGFLLRDVINDRSRKKEMQIWRKRTKWSFSLFFHVNNGSKKLSQKLLWLLEIIVLASITYFYW